MATRRQSAASLGLANHLLAVGDRRLDDAVSARAEHVADDAAAALAARLTQFSGRPPAASLPPRRLLPPPTSSTSDRSRSPLASTRASLTPAFADRADPSDSPVVMGPGASASTPATLATPAAPVAQRRPPAVRTPTSHGYLGPEPTAVDIADQLDQFRQDVKDDHARLTAYILESTQPTEWRIHHGRDLFARPKMAPVKDKRGGTIKIKFKVRVPVLAADPRR